MSIKCVFIVLDGLGDRAHASLEYKTPLQAAYTPNLDRLAAEGSTGLYHGTQFGRPLPSENAHFAMFGYDQEEFPGRGTIEALGMGWTLAPGNVAILAHFTNVVEREGNVILAHTKLALPADEVQELVEAVRFYHHEDFDIEFRFTEGRRGIIILKGTGTRYITDSDPIKDGRPLVEVRPWEAFKDDPLTLATVRALKAYLVWCHQVLMCHPVNQQREEKGLPVMNTVVTQRAGQYRAVTPFLERYGLKAKSVCSGILYRGITQYLGFEVSDRPEWGDPRKELEDRLQQAHEGLKQYDFIYVHTKTPDEAAHKRDPNLKKSVIEDLDAAIGSHGDWLLEDPEILTVVTADHSTPSSGILIHSGEPVPLLFHGEGVRRDVVSKFDECSVAGGALGSMRGRELLFMILNYLDRAKLAGLMDTPIDQPFWPGRYDPFRL